MMRKVSLKDIANQVGVSTALVSYVLNNQKEGRISKEVAQKIRDTARQLNYRINHVAKSLKTNKTHTIGLIVADISNPFFSTLARIIEDEASQHNYTVFFGSSDESPQKAARLTEALLNRQVDGLIIAPPGNAEEQVQSLAEQGVPFVLIDRHYPNIKTNYVALDNFKASFEAVEHLIETGRRRIGMVTLGTGIFDLNERIRGYREGLHKHDIPFHKSWLKEIDPSIAPHFVEKAIGELLHDTEPVDALLFGSNVIALRGLRYLNANDIRVPEQLAVISFDEAEAFDIFHAPITFIRQPLREMGQMATRILLEAIANNNRQVQVNMEGTLVKRQSTQ